MWVKREIEDVGKEGRVTKCQAVDVRANKAIQKEGSLIPHERAGYNVDVNCKRMIRHTTELVDIRCE